MAEKPRHRELIERQIAAGHKAGICDSDGNSVTLDDGRMVKKPRDMGHVRYKAVYHGDGTVTIYENGEVRVDDAVHSRRENRYIDPDVAELPGNVDIVRIDGNGPGDERHLVESVTSPRFSPPADILAHETLPS